MCMIYSPLYAMLCALLRRFVNVCCQTINYIKHFPHYVKRIPIAHFVRPQV